MQDSKREKLISMFGEIAFMATGMIMDKDVPNESVREFNTFVVEKRDEALKIFDSEISKAKKEAAEKILGIVFQEFGILSIDEKLGTVKIVLDVEKSLLSATGIDIDKLSNKRE